MCGRLWTCLDTLNRNPLLRMLPSRYPSPDCARLEGTRVSLPSLYVVHRPSDSETIRRTSRAPGAVFQPGAELAGLQRTRPERGDGRARAAARAREIPRDLQQQSRRVLHGARRWAQEAARRARDRVLAGWP